MGILDVQRVILGIMLEFEIFDLNKNIIIEYRQNIIFKFDIVIFIAIYSLIFNISPSPTAK